MDKFVFSWIIRGSRWTGVPILSTFASAVWFTSSSEHSNITSLSKFLEAGYESWHVCSPSVAYLIPSGLALTRLYVIPSALAVFVRVLLFRFCLRFYFVFVCNALFFYFVFVCNSLFFYFVLVLFHIRDWAFPCLGCAIPLFFNYNNIPVIVFCLISQLEKWPCKNWQQLITDLVNCIQPIYSPTKRERLLFRFNGRYSLFTVHSIVCLWGWPRVGEPPNHVI